MRVPLFVWSIEVYAWILVIVLPALSAGLTMLLLDRQVGTHFFQPNEGGNALLFQHVFWFFGHPEVYVMILPVMGIVSEIIPVFSRKPIFGYTAIVFSTVAIGFYSLLVWAHHMFTVGLATPLLGFFMISSMIIAVPTGIKILNWLATTWRGNLIFDTPMLFALGFIALFTIGGLSGIFLATFPIDWQAQDSYFVVAHLHYVLFGGSMFGIFAGLYYWWPKMFGRKLDETLGKWHFWLLFVGFNLAFFPQHLLGLAGMPRRIYTYSNGSWETYNLISTIGSYVMGAAILVFVVNVIWTRRRAGCSRRERPVARRHARVVHDLAASAAQFRQGSVRDERHGHCGTCASGSRRGPHEAQPLAQVDRALRSGRDAARRRLGLGRARHRAPRARRARAAAAGGGRRRGLDLVSTAALSVGLLRSSCSASRPQ